MSDSGARTCPHCGAALRPAMMRCPECRKRPDEAAAPVMNRPVTPTRTAAPAITPRSTAPVAAPPSSSNGPRIVRSSPATASAGRPAASPAASVTAPAASPVRTTTPASSTASAATYRPAAATAAPAPAAKAAVLEGDSTAQDVSSAESGSVPVDTVIVACECGARIRVPAAWAGRKRPCRKCSKLIVILGAEEPESDDDLEDQFKLRELVYGAADAIARDLPANPLGKTLSTRALKKLEAQLEITDPLSRQEAQLRRTALTDLGKSRDVRVFDLISASETDSWEIVRQGLAAALGELGDPRGLPMALRMLCDRDPGVVREALKSVRTFADPRTVKPILFLGLESPVIKLQALDAVVHIGAPAVPVLLDIMQQQDRGMVFDAIMALGRIGDERAVPVLLAALDHTSGPVRAYAVEALGMIGNASALNGLLKLLNDHDEIVRLNTVIALGRNPDPRAVRPLMQLLAEDDPDLRKRAVMALGAIGDPRAVPAIARLVPQADAGLQEVIAEALTLIGDPAAADALRLMLQSEEPGVQIKALGGIRRCGVADVLPQVMTLINAVNPQVRRRVAEVLGELGTEDAVKPLAGMLRSDPSFEVRSAAAKALGRLGYKSGLPYLEQALRDESAIRCSAVMAIAGIPDPISVAALLAMLKDPAPEVRYHAVSGLARLDAKQALPTIQVMIDDPDSMVRTGVEKALEKFGGGEVKVSSRRKFSKTMSRLVPDSVASFLPRNPIVLAGVPLALVAIFLLLSSGLSAVTPPRIVMRGYVNEVRFSADGAQILVVRQRGSVEIWDTGTLQISGDAPLEGGGDFGLLTGTTRKALIHRNGKFIPWDASQKYLDDSRALSVNADPPSELSVSANGERAVSKSGDGVMTVWKTESGDVIGQQSFSGMLTSVSADAGFVAGIWETTLKLWKVGESQAAEVSLPAEALTGSLQSLAIGTDGRTLALGHADRIALVTMTDAGMELKSVEYPASPLRIVLDGTGTLWVKDSAAHVARYALKDGKLTRWSIAALESPVRFEVEPSGERVLLTAVDSGSFWILNTASGELTEVRAPAAN